MDMKRQELMEGQTEMELIEDRISKLPDSLIHRILCFLPTKSAIRTSVLSKNWRYKWVSIPNLDFREWRSATTEDVFLETDRFMEFMDRILLLRDMSKLVNFYLVCDALFDRTRVDAWISDIVRCRVENLFLYVKKFKVPAYSPFLSPSRLFTCDSLVRLTIGMPCDLKLPTLIHFPRLKLLRLMHITFRDENFPEKFISNCPVLEELKIAYCTWEVTEDFTISAPNLKRLVCIHPPKGVIKIVAPNVQTFVYKGGIAKKYHVCRLSSLVKAEIDLRTNFENDTEARRKKRGDAVANLFKRLSRVKFLKISGSTHQALSLVDNLNDRLPAFKRLTHLKVSYACHFRYYKALLCLLKLAPNLESINFIRGFGGDNSENGITPVLPPILFSKLRIVTFGSFKGHKMELILMDFLLENASILRRMVINTCFESQETKRITMVRVLMFHERSPKSKIVFTENRIEVFKSIHSREPITHIWDKNIP